MDLNFTLLFGILILVRNFDRNVQLIVGVILIVLGLLGPLGHLSLTR